MVLQDSCWTSCATYTCHPASPLPSTSFLLFPLCCSSPGQGSIFLWVPSPKQGSELRGKGQALPGKGSQQGRFCPPSENPCPLTSLRAFCTRHSKSPPTWLWPYSFSSLNQPWWALRPELSGPRLGARLAPCYSQCPLGRAFHTRGSTHLSPLLRMCASRPVDSILGMAGHPNRTSTLGAQGFSCTPVTHPSSLSPLPHF